MVMSFVPHLHNPGREDGDDPATPRHFGDEVGRVREDKEEGAFDNVMLAQGHMLG